MIKVMIVDDHEFIRESLAEIIANTPDFTVVGMARDGREAVRQFQESNPDVILMDVRMPEIDGVAATKVIRQSSASVKILILTTFNEDEYIFNAIREGANGYLLKDISATELIATIKSVYNGGAPLNPEVSAKILQKLNQLSQQEGATSAPGIKNNPARSETFTQREMEIIRLVAQGLSNLEIGTVLYITEGTVRNHITNILGKLALKDRTQLVIYAFETGLIQTRPTKTRGKT
jgi:DNA-binding NarL/FixJ family response regulator